MADKIKVALMTYAMDGRNAKGTALYTRKLVEHILDDDRFEFYMVHYEKYDDPLYAKAHEIIMPRVRLPYGSKFLSQMLFFWKYRKEKFDIIHWFQPRVYPFFWFAPAKNIMVTVHGAGDVSAPTRFVFSRMVFNFVLTHFHRWIKCIIVVSQNAKDEVVQYYGFPQEKVRAIYNGGGENYTPINKSLSCDVVEKKYNVPSPYIFDLSRLQPHKNVVSLIRAYDRMRRDYPEQREKLLIVGGTVDAHRNEYEAARESVYSKDIIFINFIPLEDLNYFYSGAKLFAFPSLSEGFGLPVLEAMASGTPVVTSNVTSMPEIGGKAVVTVDPLDVEGLADAMYRVLTDESLRKEMIEKGVLRAKDFTWKRMAEETESLYISECRK